MSEDPPSSGDECALRIDTERSRGEKSRGKGGGKGRVRGKVAGGGAGGARRNGTRLGVGGGGGGDLKPGDVVWAKVVGFNFWPAKIFDAIGDDVVPDWLKVSPKPGYMLVRFFGTYDMQWVSPSSVEAYERGLSKKFHSKSRSKVFQKAVKEVFAYMEDSVLPEGLTLRPPDPPVFSEEEENADKQTAGAESSFPEGSSSSTVYVISCDDSNGSSAPPNRVGASRRKSSTPRRLSSSSSTDSAAKRPRLDSPGEHRGGEKSLPLSPEVQAFTCAPLPLTLPSTEETKSQKHEEATSAADGLET